MQNRQIIACCVGCSALIGATGLFVYLGSLTDWLQWPQCTVFLGLLVVIFVSLFFLIYEIGNANGGKE